MESEISVYGVKFDLDYSSEEHAAPHGEYIRSLLSTVFQDASSQVSALLSHYHSPLTFSQFQKEFSGWRDHIINDTSSFQNSNHVSTDHQNSHTNISSRYSDTRNRNEQNNPFSETDSKSVAMSTFLLFCSWKRGWTVANALENGKVCRDGWVYSGLLWNYFIIAAKLAKQNIKSNSDDTATIQGFDVDSISPTVAVDLLDFQSAKHPRASGSDILSSHHVLYWEQYIHIYFALERILQYHTPWDSGCQLHIRGLGPMDGSSSSNFKDRSHLTRTQNTSHVQNKVNRYLIQTNHRSNSSYPTPNTPTSITYPSRTPSGHSRSLSKSGIQQGSINRQYEDSETPTFAQWMFWNLNLENTKSPCVPLSRILEIFLGLCLYSSFLFACDENRTGAISWEVFKAKILGNVFAVSRVIQERIESYLKSILQHEDGDEILYGSYFRMLLQIEFQNHLNH